MIAACHFLLKIKVVDMMLLACGALTALGGE